MAIFYRPKNVFNGAIDVCEDVIMKCVNDTRYVLLVLVHSVQNITIAGVGILNKLESIIIVLMLSGSTKGQAIVLYVTSKVLYYLQPLYYFLLLYSL